MATSLTGFSPEAVAVLTDLALFVGRLHPLVVHLPIGMLLLVAVLELAGWRCKGACLPPAVRLVMLAVAALSAAFAAGCGWLLARDGGYDVGLLERHRWFGVTTAVLAFALLFARRWSRAYGVLLVATVSTLAIAGHDGGTLTHGSGYLADAAPRFLRPWLGGAADEVPPPASLAEADAFRHVVQPILHARCVSCHGESKSDGDLRLDSFAALTAGGKSGTALTPGDPNASLLLRRLYLPLNDKKHMPPAGRPQPTEGDLTILEWWIENGAPEQARLADLAPSREIATLLAQQLGLPPPALPDRATMLAAAAKLETELGILVRPLHGTEPWLAVNARLRGRQFGDDQLAALRPIAPALHRLDLGGTAVTDAGLAHLGTMSELRRLQLDGTAVSDSGLVHLKPLAQLESLNLHTTTISDAGLEPLRALPRLRRLYVWQTTVTPSAAQQLASSLEDRRRLQRYRAEMAELQSKLTAETFQSDFGVEVATTPPASSPSANPASGEQPVTQSPKPTPSS